MYFDINTYLLIYIGWFIQKSYQLDCVQCTSPIRRISRNWDHSCLDGTLTPIPCQKPVNETEKAYQQCTSDLFRLSGQGNLGVLLDRRCITHPIVLHECDPPESYRHFDKSNDFFCRRTCTNDGCNRHSFKDILANANQLFKFKSLLLYILSIVFLFS